MAVPSSGAVSIQDLVDEFGGSTPHSISEYYRGGSLVPNVSANNSVPTSGTVALTNFYGAVDATFIAASGGTETTSGDFKIHTFNSNGTFTVNSVGNSAGSNTVEYLVVAGGGGGGNKQNAGGGGGAGGYRTAASFSVSAQGYSITVGGGGSGTNTRNVPGSTGSNSVFF